MSAGRREASGERGSVSAARNTIGLGRNALRDLLDTMDDGDATNDAGASGRTFARHLYRLETLPVEITHGDGSATRLKMAARNISAGGVSLLHSGFMHEGSKLRVFLPHASTGVMQVHGAVRRCRHVKGIVHEIGVQFVKEIDLREVSWLDTSHAWFRFDKVRPHQLIGKVLCVDDAKSEQDRFLDLVRGSRLTVRRAATADEALQEIIAGVEVAFVDYHLGRESAEPLFTAVRQLNLNTPLVLVTVADPNEVRGLLKRLRPASFLRKPFDRHALLRAVAEFVGISEDEDDFGASDAA